MSIIFSRLKTLGWTRSAGLAPVTCVMHSTCDCEGDYDKRHWASPAFIYRVMAVTSERGAPMLTRLCPITKEYGTRCKLLAA
jgi:hypothetical protein